MWSLHPIPSIAHRHDRVIRQNPQRNQKLELNLRPINDGKGNLGKMFNQYSTIKRYLR